MIVLGILGFGMNPAACLVREGRLVAFVEEERFTRMKGSHGLFPSRAVAWCLSSEGLELGDVDRIAFGWDAKAYPWKVGRVYARTLFDHYGRLRRMTRGRSSPPYLAAAEYLFRWHPSRIRGGIRDGLRAAGLKGDLPPIVFVDHHLAHAYSSYPLSGFERAGILTVDGSGECMTTQLALGEGETIRVLDTLPIPHSLGWFYAAITQYLGFLPYRDEGKLMGLAALGETRARDNRWREPLSEILRIGSEDFEVDPLYTHLGDHSHGDRFTDALVERLTGIDPSVTPVAYGEKVLRDGHPISRYLLEPYVDLAWAAQELLERAALVLARRLVTRHGIRHLCLAGGVAMNCKMNSELLRRSGIEHIFVQPASNDAGSALGAALYVAQQEGDPIRRPLRHVRYGPAFDDTRIAAALDGCKLRYRRVEDPAAEAAALLSQGKLCGWFQGNLEFGARALGGRSILADPTDPGIRDRVNREVKFRESWRPFCPSMTESAAPRYLVDPDEAAFMIVAYPATEKCRRALPSVVHVDGTVRPQVVDPEVDPLYHRLLSECGRHWGHEVVLNTSFNVRGEPIVCTPHEALRCFHSSGLDALVMGSFVLEK